MMRLRIYRCMVFMLLGASFCSVASARKVWEEQDGVVHMEAEETTSSLKKWELKQDISGYSGAGYLEFTGNTPMNGPPESKLKYTFKIHTGGFYYLELCCARQQVDGRNDLANDCYVRLKGNFGSGPNPGDEHGMDAPLDMLKEDTKFFGGDDRKFVWVSGNRLDPGGHRNKRVAIYHFEEGETYSLFISGRSQLFKLDQIVFRLDREMEE